MVTPAVTTKVNNSNYDVSADQWNALIAAVKNQGYSYIVYKSGSTYYARNGATGAVDYSETTLADALTEAFTALTAGGGVIFLSQLAFPMASFASIPEGVRVVCNYGAEYWEYINSANSQGSPYTVSVGTGVNVGYYYVQDKNHRICYVSANMTTLLTTINSLASTSHIIFTSGTFTFDSPVTITKGKLSGQGTNTVLSFVFDSSQTSGLILKGFYISVSDMTITGNENVTNIVHVQPNGQKGWLYNLSVRGTNPITSGQVGIFFDGSFPAVYEYKVDNCEFIYCDVGMKLTGYSNAEFISNINIAATNLGISIDSDMNMISNVFAQTPTVAVIRLTANSYANQIVNVHGESNTCPTLLLDAGSRYNQIGQVRNTGSGGPITDDSGYAQQIDMAAAIPSTPNVSTSDVYNTYGGNALVEITVGGTSTNIVKNGATYKGSVSNITCYVIVAPGERLRVSQTTGVTWTWRGLP